MLEWLRIWTKRYHPKLEKCDGSLNLQREGIKNARLDEMGAMTCELLNVKKIASCCGLLFCMLKKWPYIVGL